ncbi:tryptophan synthase, alpha chain [Pedobacter westerhofensis]|uniref:Tryptophan synthase alpha chain n=1 Tax=Pedobacter westerhofensis TaxID=425512 RepID=A0A521E8R3_9SPHI|nr:tryptophan synthase subunit alpha [Pedobacter westerhofensis]SMO80172.1 tryptophan synthase, alpha chain [Pedobacter westerhofensis]
MNRITQLFQEKKNNILSIYYTAGYPGLGDTVAIAEALQAAGADMLEIGFPYSDPVADGPVIQASSKAALDSGMDLNLLFAQLKELRKKVTIPVLLMGYVNPVLQFGVENFCKACVEAGIDGVIVPDLPMYEYEELYQEIFLKNNLCNIFLVTPQTSEERIRKIDGLSNGFIYLLSASATTGKNLNVSDITTTYFSRVAEMNLDNPIMIGFGINSKETFEKACKYANGGIIGTAFVKAVETGDLQENIRTFMQEFR